MAILRIRDKDGIVQEIPVIKGDKGDTPIKGVDYYTETDKAEMIEELTEYAAPVSYAPQDLTEEQQARARANIGAVSENSDTQTVYFDVTDDGTVYLKPEYRGGQQTTEDYPYSVSDGGVGVVGSKNSRLPRHLIIPDVVNGIEVKNIAPAAFRGNVMLESVSIPSTITTIPSYCFYYCRNLHDIYFTTQITEVKEWAFYGTIIKEAEFPNLTTLGESAFAYCYNLITANIGNITELPKEAFYACNSLYSIKGGLNITSIGVGACLDTLNLTHVEFIEQEATKVETIGGAAFLQSRFIYDWSKLTNCTFGSYATSAQPSNTSDFWTALIPNITQCENPTPTLLCQKDDRWGDNTIGNSSKTYRQGCMLMAFIHAYCGLKGLRLNTVDDFESIVNTISPSLLDSYNSNGFAWINTIATALGITVESYKTYNAESLQALYTALAEGKYALAATGTGMTSYLGTSYEKYITVGHVVLIHGVRADGKLIIADSARSEQVDNKQTGRYALPYQAFIHPNVMVDYGCDSLYILS